MSHFRSFSKLLPFLLAALGPAPTLKAAPWFQPNVVNGTSTIAWPGMGAIVMIQGVEYSECSAVLIAPNWALTAGHCLTSGVTPQFTMSLQFIGMTTVYYAADSTFIHPDYVIGGAASEPYDVGLIHFATPIPAMPYRINDNVNLVQIGKAIQFIGYGQTIAAPEGSGNNVNRYLGTSVISAFDTHSVSSQSGSFPCYGDSGAGWFVRNANGYPLVVGVQSYIGTDNCTGVSSAAATTDVLAFISSHVTDLCLTSPVGAPCEGIFRNEFE